MCPFAKKTNYKRIEHIQNPFIADLESTLRCVMLTQRKFGHAKTIHPNKNKIRENERRKTLFQR